MNMQPKEIVVKFGAPSLEINNLVVSMEREGYHLKSSQKTPKGENVKLKFETKPPKK